MVPNIDWIKQQKRTLHFLNLIYFHVILMLASLLGIWKCLATKHPFTASKTLTIIFSQKWQLNVNIATLNIHLDSNAFKISTKKLTKLLMNDRHTDRHGNNNITQLITEIVLIWTDKLGAAQYSKLMLHFQHLSWPRHIQSHIYQICL